MSLQQKFRLIKLDKVHEVAVQKKEAHWRCVQILCTSTDNGIDITYSYQKDDVMDNLAVKGVTKDQHVQSITDVYEGQFPFENEAHDLFGVQVDNISIDFKGRFYDLAVPEPMTIISPEKKARMEKAAKIQAAKEAKAARDKAAKEGKPAPEPSPDKEAAAKAALEKKLAGMDPEKAARVRAAMEAKAKRDAQKKAAATDKGGEA